MDRRVNLEQRSDCAPCEALLAEGVRHAAITEASFSLLQMSAAKLWMILASISSAIPRSPPVPARMHARFAAAVEWNVEIACIFSRTERELPPLGDGR